MKGKRKKRINKAAGAERLKGFAENSLGNCSHNTAPLTLADIVGWQEFESHVSALLFRLMEMKARLDNIELPITDRQNQPAINDHQARQGKTRPDDGNKSL